MTGAPARGALRALDLSGLPRLTSEGVAALALGVGSRLEALSLQKCVDVTDIGVEALVRHALVLRRLWLGDCQNVHLAPQLIGERCALIEDVDFGGAEQVSAGSGVGGRGGGCGCGRGRRRGRRRGADVPSPASSSRLRRSPTQLCTSCCARASSWCGST